MEVFLIRLHLWRIKTDSERRIGRTPSLRFLYTLSGVTLPRVTVEGWDWSGESPPARTDLAA